MRYKLSDELLKALAIRIATLAYDHMTQRGINVDPATAKRAAVAAGNKASQAIELALSEGGE